MIDRLFSLALLFSVLVGGTLAIGGELLTSRHAATAQTRIATLPRVVITGKKQPARTDLARVDNTSSPGGAAKFTQ